MAREPRTRRGRHEEEVPVVAPEAPAGEAGGRAGRERPTKAPSGPSFAMPVAVTAGFLAGLLAFLGAFIVAGATAPKDQYESLDAGGVQAARMLAALDVDRWKKEFGTTAGVRAKVQAEIDRHVKEVQASGDSRDVIPMEEDISRWRAGAPKVGNEWRPGIDLIFPQNDPMDEAAETARRTALQWVQEQNPGAFIGAAVMNESGASTVSAGEIGVPAVPPVKNVGGTLVYSVGTAKGPARVYIHPMRNRLRQPDQGKAVVILAASKTGGSPIAAAGAAGGLGFLGGFLGAFFLALGPVGAMRKLASETEAIAKGEYGTRVTLRGPDVVQAAARNVQKIAHAAGSAATAQPQMVVQEVVRAPVQEVQEGLAPLRGFQRPDEFELEATQKLCAEIGNDYYDVVNVDAENVGLFIADIPIRGVRGSMYMSQVRALFRAQAKGQVSPAEVLRQVNRAFAMDLPRGVYVTAMYAIVNKSSGICRVASAQHLPLVFWKLAKKGSARLSPEGIALGLDAGPVFDRTLTEQAIQLEKGDRIVLYTDGAISTKNANGAQYGEERFYYVVNREAPKNSAAAVNFIANDVDLFHEGAAQLDDFTILTLRRVK